MKLGLRCARTVDPDNNSTRIQSNVIVERQIGAAWQASASHLGSYADRIWAQVRATPASHGHRAVHARGRFHPTCTTTANLNQRRCCH
jgi:hypothetical protein